MKNYVFAPLGKEFMEWAEIEAERRLIGGRSQLPEKYLEGGSDKRMKYQITSIVGESLFHQYRYGNLNYLQELLDSKFKTRYIGDDGFDDRDGIDIKCSQSRDDKQLPSMHLVVPKKELHSDRFYVSAFYCPKTNHSKLGLGEGSAFLVGWAITDDVKKWPDFRLNPESHATRITNLRPIKELKTYLSI